MQNKELKKQMLENGVYSDIRKYNSKLIKEGSSIKTEIFMLKIDKYLNGKNNNKNYINQLAINHEATQIGVHNDELISFMQMQHAKQEKSKRINKSIKSGLYLGYRLIFATLTFNDKTLKLTKRTRRNYIKKYLSQYDGSIANIDYGGKNGREHYHAIIFFNPKYIDEFTYTYKYNDKKKRRYKVINNLEEVLNIEKYKYCDFNLYDFQLIDPKDENSNDYNKLSNYIAKLTNHALKVEQQRMIYDVNRLVNLKNFK